VHLLEPTFCSCRMRLYSRCASSSANFLARFSCSRLVPRLHVLLRSPSTPTSAMVARLVQPACKQPSRYPTRLDACGCAKTQPNEAAGCNSSDACAHADARLLLAQSVHANVAVACPVPWKKRCSMTRIHSWYLCFDKHCVAASRDRPGRACPEC
jgi:hypothetical protein